MDIARSIPDNEGITFISNDTKAFGSSHILDETLLQEANSQGLFIRYYNSIEQFIHGYATSIEFITEEWILQSINNDVLEDKMKQILQTYLSRLDNVDRRWRDWEGLDFNGYVNFQSSTISSDSIDEYYVYERTNGTYYVEVEIIIEIEIKFIFYERVRNESLYRWSRSNEDLYDDEDLYINEHRNVCKYRELSVTFGMDVENRNVTNIDVTNWSL